MVEPHLDSLKNKNNSDLISLFCCPDDRSELYQENNFLICKLCNKKFKVDGKIIDFRPSKKFDFKSYTSIEKDYRTYYESLSLNGKPSFYKKPFGLASGSYSAGLFKEIVPHLRNRITSRSIVCDIGAGTGDYSVHLAKYCKVMFHCDLDQGGIKIALKNSLKQNLDNIFFLICDYFFLPLKNEISNLAYSIDVIERGEKNDKLLLNEITRVTSKNGYSIFDCHAKERAKFTHVVSKKIKHYSKTEIRELAKSSSLKTLNMVGTGYLPQVKTWSAFTYNILNPIAKFTHIPPARWLLTCKPE